MLHVVKTYTISEEERIDNQDFELNVEEKTRRTQVCVLRIQPPRRLKQKLLSGRRRGRERPPARAAVAPDCTEANLEADPEGCLGQHAGQREGDQGLTKFKRYFFIDSASIVRLHPPQGLRSDVFVRNYPLLPLTGEEETELATVVREREISKLVEADSSKTGASGASPSLSPQTRSPTSSLLRSPKRGRTPPSPSLQSMAIVGGPKSDLTLGTRSHLFLPPDALHLLFPQTELVAAPQIRAQIVLLKVGKKIKIPKNYYSTSIASIPCDVHRM